VTTLSFVRQQGSRKNKTTKKPTRKSVLSSAIEADLENVYRRRAHLLELMHAEDAPDVATMRARLLAETRRVWHGRIGATMVVMMLRIMMMMIVVMIITINENIICVAFGFLQPA
jgi:hypothetical protein